MILEMDIATALCVFNDLERSVTPTFLFRKPILLTTIYTLSKNEQKVNVEVKKFQECCPGVLESCHPATVRLNYDR